MLPVILPGGETDLLPDLGAGVVGAVGGPLLGLFLVRQSGHEARALGGGVGHGGELGAEVGAGLGGVVLPVEDTVGVEVLLGLHGVGRGEGAVGHGLDFVPGEGAGEVAEEVVGAPHAGVGSGATGPEGGGGRGAGRTNGGVPTIEGLTW